MLINKLDSIINNFFQNNYTTFWKEFFIYIAYVWDKYGILLLSLLFIIFLFYNKKYLRIFFLLFMLLFWALITYVLKCFFMRERPINMIIDYSGYSFPSGHSIFAILFYGLFLYLWLDLIKNKYIKLFFIVLSLILSTLIIISRLYLSVHYFSDVLWWIIIWFFLLFTWIYIFKFINKKIWKN